VWELRRKTSLLLSHGHPAPYEYPLGFLGDEVALIVEQENGRIASESMLIYAAAAAVMSEKAGQHFMGLIKQLVGE
jgi:hypothetical protein